MLMARSRRRRIPPEYLAARRSAASARPNSASSSTARVRAARRDRRSSWAIISRFSRPVSFSSTAAYCPVRLIDRLTPTGSVSRSCPAMVADPASGRIRVARILTIVVLPAPFGPSRASTDPAPAARST